MTPIELIIAVFKEEGEAKNALHHIRNLENENLLTLLNAAVLVKDEKGRLSMQETQDVSGRQGAIFGAIAGALVGLLGGPAGVIVGAAAGAAAGGIAASKMDMGFSDQKLKELQHLLKPGTSAIIALIDHDWVESVAQELEKIGAVLYHQAIKEDILEKLADKLDDVD